MYTQRIVQSEELVVLGAQGAYEARCRVCYDPVNRPTGPRPRRWMSTRPISYPALDSFAACSFLVTWAGPPDATSSPLRSVSLMSTLAYRRAPACQSLATAPMQGGRRSAIWRIIGPDSPCQEMGIRVDPSIDSQRSDNTWLYFARRAHRSFGSHRRKGPSRNTRPSASREKR